MTHELLSSSPCLFFRTTNKRLSNMLSLSGTNKTDKVYLKQFLIANYDCFHEETVAAMTAISHIAMCTSPQCGFIFYVKKLKTIRIEMTELKHHGTVLEHKTMTLLELCEVWFLDSSSVAGSKVLASADYIKLIDSTF